MMSDRGRRKTAPAAPVTLDRLVTGVDFSAPSVAAVGWVREHFAPEAQALVVHALDIPAPPRFLRADLPSREEVLTSARAGAMARLEELRRAQNWGPVGLHVAEGRPEDVIAEAAAQTQADLIVAGEHTHPRGSWNMPGSTAEALVRCSRVPVLLARAPAARTPQRILVAVDDSDHARIALAWADMLAHRPGATLTVLHVFHPVYLGVAKIVSGMQASVRLEQEQFEQTAAWLDQLVRESVRVGEVVPRLERGDPVSAVVAAQRGGDFDVVVIGSRGAGGAARMLLGSVANGVLRGASCPVLVASARDE